MPVHSVYQTLLKGISWVLRLSHQAVEFTSPSLSLGWAALVEEVMECRCLVHASHACFSYLWIAALPSCGQFQGHLLEDKGPASPAASANSQQKRGSVKEIILDPPGYKLMSNTWASPGKVSTIVQLPHRLQRNNKSLRFSATEFVSVSYTARCNW